jgi:cephalosporin-C deacetylase-like acetyl esterase
MEVLAEFFEHGTTLGGYLVTVSGLGPRIQSPPAVNPFVSDPQQENEIVPIRSKQYHELQSLLVQRTEFMRPELRDIAGRRTMSRSFWM